MAADLLLAQMAALLGFHAGLHASFQALGLRFELRLVLGVNLP